MLVDGMSSDTAAELLLKVIRENGEIISQNGLISGQAANKLPALLEGGSLGVGHPSAEQSMPSITYGDSLILKVIHHQHSGPNPDSEVSKYLSESTGFQNVPPFGGLIEYRAGEGPSIRSQYFRASSRTKGTAGNGRWRNWIDIASDAPQWKFHLAVCRWRIPG